jgi:hypothetical protein
MHLLATFFLPYSPPVKEIHEFGETQLGLLMRSALFWDITRCRVVIVYRCFGKTYRSHLHGSRRRVISQNNADLINIAAEA